MMIDDWPADPSAVGTDPQAEAAMAAYVAALE